MTHDYIAIARTRRMIALAGLENRKMNGAAYRKIQTLPTLTPNHIDALFQSSRGVRVATDYQLAA